MIIDPKDPFGEGPEAAKARKNRNLAIAGGLVAFIVLVFVITLVKLSGNVAS
jgi:hypothetical protein